MSFVLVGDNIEKTYSNDGIDHKVLSGISFSVDEKDFIAIMGPSGSGKSTLLNNISGLDKPSSGRVVLDGEYLDEKSEKELSEIRLNKIGFIFQKPNLVKCLSVKENILLTAMLLKRKTAGELNSIAKDLLIKTGIERMENSDISVLSGGEAQRVGICRCLINSPRIIFADEPTGALNSKSSDEIMDLLIDINDGGSTIIIVTHDSKVAARAKQVWFLMDGKIVSKINLGRYVHEHSLERQQVIMKEMTKLGV